MKAFQTYWCGDLKLTDEPLVRLERREPGTVSWVHVSSLALVARIKLALLSCFPGVTEEVWRVCLRTGTCACARVPGEVRAEALSQ